MARLLKKAGYATGQAGKWRQIGESPKDWGFDEYLTDNTASGWYWETHYNKNGKDLNLPRGTYGPDVIQEFTYDFIRRHKGQPFFFYYAMHLVHKPTLRTPDTKPGTKNIDKLYDDNIRYMDKQLGALLDELERLGLRENTLVIFSGDNGTAAGYPSPVRGRMIHGWKGTMLEGGSRVPFIASWPAMTPKGKTTDDIISFADSYATFAELAGVKPPDGFKTDGQSFAAQLQGKPHPRVPAAGLGLRPTRRPLVRPRAGLQAERGWRVVRHERCSIHGEARRARADDTEASKAARQRLTAALHELNPAGGKTDREGRQAASRRRPWWPGGRGGPAPVGSASAVGPWKSGATLSSAEAPAIGGKALKISADIEPAGPRASSSLKARAARGYAVYLTGGKLAFAVRENGNLTTIVAKEPLGSGRFHIEAALRKDGSLVISVDGKQVAAGRAAGLIDSQPRAGFSVGDAQVAVGDYPAPNPFKGKIANVRVKAD